MQICKKWLLGQLSCKQQVMGRSCYYGLHKHNKAFISNYCLICTLWIEYIALLAFRALVNTGFDFLLVKDTSQPENNIMRPVSSLSVGRREKIVQRQKNTKIAGAQVAPSNGQLGFQDRSNLSPEILFSFMKHWRRAFPAMTANKMEHLFLSVKSRQVLGCMYYSGGGKLLLISAVPETVPSNGSILEFKAWKQGEHRRDQPKAVENKVT